MNIKKKVYFEITENNSLSILFLIIAVLSVWRFTVASNLPFSVDEAYYIAWSKNLEFGYWTKPPVIAWIIGLARFACGETQSCIRLAPILSFTISAFIIYAISLKFKQNKTTSLIISLIFFTLPLSFFYGIAATTDSLLLLFWSLSIFFFKSAIEGNNFSWLFLGLSCGLGLLSKYTMILFGISVFLILLHSEYKIYLKTIWPYITIIITLLVFSPNIWWNYINNFPTFNHTIEISKADGYEFNFFTLLKFLVSQIGLGGPIVFVFFLFWLFNNNWIKSKDNWFFIMLSIPYFFIISLQAFLSRAHANWALPAFICSIFISIKYLKHKKNFLIFSFFINLSIGILLYHFDKLIVAPLNLTPSIKNDPFWSLRSWPDFSNKVYKIATKEKDFELTIASDDRSVLSELQAVFRLPPESVLGWKKNKVPQNYFEHKFPIQESKRKKILLITKSSRNIILNSFSKIKFAGKIHSEIIKGRPLNYNLWWVEK